MPLGRAYKQPHGDKSIFGEYYRRHLGGDEIRLSSNVALVISQIEDDDPEPGDDEKHFKLQILSSDEKFGWVWSNWGKVL